MWRWRRRVEVVLAASAGDDATAALTMILRYHGRRVSFDEVRRAIYQPEDLEIPTAMEVVAAAERFRMHVRGLELRDPKDFADIPTPSIVHMRTEPGAFPHGLDKLQPGAPCFFGVMVAVSPERIRWIDPYTGEVEDEHDLFFAFASGVFLAFTEAEPIPRARLRS